MQRLTFDRSFSGTLTAASQFVSCLRALVLRPIVGPARELHVTDQAGARVRARLVLVNQIELRSD